MAEIVLGLGTSHSPQLGVPWDQWDLLRDKDENDPRFDYRALLSQAKPGIQRELTPDVWQRRWEACQQGIARLGEVLRQVAPHAIVILGDDQHEQFEDDNLPALAIYHGKTLHIVKDHVLTDLGGRAGGWKAAEEASWAETAPEYRAAWELAEHLIGSLTAAEFDVTRTNRLRQSIGLGHAFSFLYRRIWPGGTLPMVPIMINTYYPPNQPTPKRCYALGQTLRQAIERWDSDARVAVMASGGLSHMIIDEQLDQTVLGALREKDRERLWALPRDRLRGGSSEILNWVALAGAVEPLPMELLDYVPTYRSPAGTGVGMAFSYWAA